MQSASTSCTPPYDPLRGQATQRGPEAGAVLRALLFLKHAETRAAKSGRRGFIRMCSRRHSSDFDALPHSHRDVVGLPMQIRDYERRIIRYLKVMRAEQLCFGTETAGYFNDQFWHFQFIPHQDAQRPGVGRTGPRSFRYVENT